MLQKRLKTDKTSVVVKIMQCESVLTPNPKRIWKDMDVIWKLVPLDSHQGKNENL